MLRQQCEAITGIKEYFFSVAGSLQLLLVVSALFRKDGNAKKQVDTCWRRRPGPGRGKESLILRNVSLPAEDALVLLQNELHDLVLVDHVDGHVEGLGFRPQQRGAKHDGHALGGHAVLLPVVDHPKRT